MIRGKRNFITPSKLELGMTIMFMLNEESIANHIGERRPRLALEEMENPAQDQTEEDMEIMDDDETSELSRTNSVATTVNEEYSVIQIGENKELMEQRRQQQFKKKQQQKEQQKAKADKKAGKGKPKHQEEEPEEKGPQKGKDKQVRGKKNKLQKIKEKYGD